MLIDWFTVAAQTINFLILVWLLKRFLYQPILDAVDAREQRIAGELADAERKRTEARQEREEYERKNEEFAQQREVRLSKLQDEVNATRHKMLEEAQEEANLLSAKRKLAFQREQKSLGEEISRRTQEQVFSIARKTLHDLADTSLEASVTSLFTRRVRELNDETRHELATMLVAAKEPARVRSAFELSSEQQHSIQKVLHETFETDIPLQFETSPEVISGIELISNGRSVSWSIDGYLSSLTKTIVELPNRIVNHDHEFASESEPV